MSILRYFGLRLKRGARKRPRQSLRRATPAVEHLTPRLVLSASPMGAMVQDTGEYLLGSSAVTVVLMESTGVDSTEDWDAAGIAAVKAKVEEALVWWQDTIANVSPVHRLAFSTDYQYADNPVETTVEPIAEKSNVYTTWVNHFLNHADANTSDGISADIRKFNHAQLQQHGTDWGFTIFVVNDANDADGMFAEGGSFRRAFAFAGGRYMIVPAGRPASSFAHELGHMFWGRDEYAGGGSYTDRRGYYNAQNTNAYDNPDEGFVQQPSIMGSGSLLATAYANNTSSQSSYEMLGWRDSDADGIFDVLDVPHTLLGSGEQVGNEYHFEAFAFANTLINENSSGFHSDITLNRVDLVEYRFDDGSWIVWDTPGTATAEIALQVTVPEGAGQIEVRTRSIDPVSQQTVAQSSSFLAVVNAKTVNAGQGLAGYVWSDVDGSDLWNAGEEGVSGVILRLVDGSGNPLDLSTSADADGFGNEVELNTQFAEISLAAVGTHVLDSTVYSRVHAQAATGDRVFANDNAATNSIVTKWGQDSRTLRASFDSAQSAVAITAIADGDGDVARLEAYDFQGNLLERTTSGVLSAGESVRLHLARPEDDISYVIARAHYNTEVLFDNLVFGPEAEAVTDDQGVFRFTGLPDGEYRVEAVADNGRQPGTAPILTRTLSGGLPVVDLAFGIDLPPWLNASNSEDIDGDDVVSPLDALIIINDLNANGARELPAPTPSFQPPPFLDSSGDGWVTSLDALRVINLLNAGAGAEGESLALDVSAEPAETVSATDFEASLLEVESIQVESEIDYRYHCQAVDLTLELWFSEDDDSLGTKTIDELEPGSVENIANDNA